MIHYNIEDATKALTVARSLISYKAPFTIIDTYRLIDDGVEPEATVQIEASGQVIHEASNGNGPVDALAKVLKKALIPLFPELDKVKLVDFRANILDAQMGTGTTVEVTILLTDGEKVWKVSRFSGNINSAAFYSLVDGFEYAVHK